MAYEIETQNINGLTTALGTSGPHSVVVDRPVESGGGGHGFSGGELLHLAVAACISNDLFREADGRGIELDRVKILVDGDFGGEPTVSQGITYEVELTGQATDTELHSLVEYVDSIAEIPNSLRLGTNVRLVDIRTPKA
jgi:putative redox protein